MENSLYLGSSTNENDTLFTPIDLMDALVVNSEYEQYGSLYDSEDY